MRPSLSEYVSGLLWHVIEADDLLRRRYGPFLDLTALEGDTVILRDHKQDRLVEVFVKEGDLHCRLDESSECYHVGYCYALPDVYKVLVEKSVKAPITRKKR